MSSLLCNCGYTISFVQAPCPYESKVISKKHFARVLLEMVQVLASLRHLEPADRRNWIVQRFGDEYPIDLEDASVLEDVLVQQLTDIRWLATCPNCGRLHLQANTGEAPYRTYVLAESAATNHGIAAER